MSERLLLIDTDMLVLLGGSDTLLAALELLGFQAAQTRRLAAAVHQLERGRSFKDAYAGSVLQAALRAARTVEPIREQPADPLLLDRLAGTSGVDLGEAELFALLAEHEGYYLTTGDRRSIVALATNENLAAVRERVAARIVCLESILRLLVARNGAKATALAFHALRTHKTIAVLLSDSQAQSNEVCLQGIDSYLNDLIRKTGEGFLFLPQGIADGT
jgi:hypothetical protein